MKHNFFSFFLSVLLVNFFYFVFANNEITEDPSELQNLSDILKMNHDEIKNKMNLLFTVIDTNSDGIIDKEELESWAYKIRNVKNLKQGMVELSAMDADKDNKVSLGEILLAHKDSFQNTVPHEKLKEDLKKRFNVVDKNKDGGLDAQEMSLLINPGNNTELIQLEADFVLNAQDEDKDGNINLEEFLHQENIQEELKEGDEELKKEFALYDLDSNGLISVDEIKAAILTATMSEYVDSINKMLNTTENHTIPQSVWNENYYKYALSIATDNGEILTYPESYDLGIPFKNKKDNISASNEHEEL